MSIEWFDKEPGEDVAQSTSDPRMVLVGSGVPDWVRLPPELGGTRVRVLSAHVGPCPRGDHQVRHLALDSDPRTGAQVHVAECRAHGGFLWYRSEGAEL